MATHDIDEVIESGDYGLTITDSVVKMTRGDSLTYKVVEGGEVQEDGSIPIRIKIKAPRRYRGRIVAAKLVPMESIPLADMAEGDA